ncbi:MAG: PP2C family protein-serine/threonine phosphatase [Actinomycetota bacterium]|nr:PP2C family protein-serine/threonine phosphatase [Actinomycetota bacterium]
MLLALDQAHPSEMLQILHNQLSSGFGAIETRLLVADYDQTELRRLDDLPVEHLERLQIDGTDAGASFREQRPIEAPTGSAGDSETVYLPVSMRGERLGVLVVRMRVRPDRPTLDALQAVATTVSYVLYSAARYTDAFERARRHRQLSLPAEMQWALLPARAFRCPEFTVAGQLVPAYEVGGDVFDYAIESDKLTVSVIDAMGHALEASVMAGLALASLRNRRRAGEGISEQLAATDRRLYDYRGGDHFVTALQVEIDVKTGRGRVASAGHPPARRLRDGEVTSLSTVPNLPLGLTGDTDYDVTPIELRDGDRLLLLSDGVIESRSTEGEEFGDRLLDRVLVDTAKLPAGEATIRLQEAVRAHSHPLDLRDDATLVLLDWRGSHELGFVDRGAREPD